MVVKWFARFFGLTGAPPGEIPSVTHPGTAANHRPDRLTIPEVQGLRPNAGMIREYLDL